MLSGATSRPRVKGDEAGIGHIAEDRHRHGLVLEFTLAENLALRDYRRPSSAPASCAWATCVTGARRLLGRVRRPRRWPAGGRRPRGRQSAEGRVAREIASEPKVLIAHQPTRGLDVGAIEFVHRRLVAERDRGRAVLLVSLEYEEVRALADRILVIYEGKIVGEFPPDVSEETLGIAMTGGRPTEAAA